MGKIEERQICQEMRFKESDKSGVGRVQWVLMETKNDVCKVDHIESDLDDSFESSCSSETIEDPSSSSSSSCSSPLFELSELMAQLPIKRGLSKFYQGKSESFTSLTSVKSIEDLAKKGKYSCRLSPKATITKNKKGSLSSITKSSIFSSLGNLGSLIAS